MIQGEWGNPLFLIVIVAEGIMTAREVCQRVWDISAPCAAEMGIHLWDVTFEKEGGQYMLTITIDREGHTDIDDCEKLSRYVDPFLDEKEFASLPPYTLCVSSSGAFCILHGTGGRAALLSPDQRQQNRSRHPEGLRQRDRLSHAGGGWHRHRL